VERRDARRGLCAAGGAAGGVGVPADDDRPTTKDQRPRTNDCGRTENREPRIENRASTEHPI
jgi:hypothetical protein